MVNQAPMSISHVYSRDIKSSNSYFDGDQSAKTKHSPALRQQESLQNIIQPDLMIIDED
jgi:hypothetical protein